MKELTEIIEKLHNINEQMVEKDNTLNDLSTLVELISQMITDADFIRSAVYLDLRAKYILQIEEKLKNMERKQITIEPEELTISKQKKDEQGKKVKHFTKAEVRGPLRTDIFAAPKCRRTYARKKVEPTDKDKDKDKDDTDVVKKEQYISFNDGDDIYYIHVIDNVNQFDIYDQEMSLVGHLKGATITIISDAETLQSKTIKLRTVSKTDREYLFSFYVLDSA